MPTLEKIAKTAAALVVAAGTVLALNGPAAALSGSDYATTTETPSTAPDPATYSWPTPNIERLDKAMRVNAKSVSSSLRFDKGITSAYPNIKISVTFGNSGVYTQNYSWSNGNRFAYTFPAGDGQQRYELLRITMVERLNGVDHTYSTTRHANIRPLWNVNLSSLKFKLLEDCDPWSPGDSEIVLFFSHSAAWGNVEFSLGKGDTKSISAFAKSWTEVGLSDDLRVPLINYWEDDPGEATLGGGDGGQPLSEERLLPATTYTKSWIQENPQCDAFMEYRVGIALRTYNL